MKSLIAAALMLGAMAVPTTAQERLSVALDWTPNTNHVGLYVAQAQGWFEEAGLEIPYSKHDVYIKELPAGEKPGLRATG